MKEYWVAAYGVYDKNTRKLRYQYLGNANYKSRGDAIKNGLPFPMKYVKLLYIIRVRMK